MTARAAILVHDGRVLIERRAQTGLLAGLWQFPALDDSSDIGELHEHLEAAGVQAHHIGKVGEVSHRFSHIEMTIEIHEYSAENHAGVEAPFRWISPKNLDEVALSRAMRKVQETAAPHLG
jgi:A/G-specific adenine glycosylase